MNRGGMRTAQCCSQERINRDEDIIETREFRDRDRTKIYIKESSFKKLKCCYLKKIQISFRSVQTEAETGTSKNCRQRGNESCHCNSRMSGSVNDEWVSDTSCFPASKKKTCCLSHLIVMGEFLKSITALFETLAKTYFSCFAFSLCI